MYIIYHFSPNALLELLQSALDQCDIIVTSGGVSMGERVSYSLLAVSQCLHAFKSRYFEGYRVRSTLLYRSSVAMLNGHSNFTEFKF